MLDQYQLIDRIGVGGMAEVWRATMKGTAGFERQVAIKRILPSFSGDEDFVSMFVDEAKIAVRLSHPCIVEIFDLGRAGDEWFIAMELVHGKDMRAIADAEAARGQRVPLEVACHAIMKICEALHHAHFLDHDPLNPAASRQIIHRDVSPQNILVSYEGEVKVTDFGLAKAAGRAAQTQAGTIKGKLAYMSPEQLRGLPLDQRSDLFAVGIVLWELLTGERLFLGQNDRDTIAKAFACKVPPPTTIDPTIDAELERITLRALAPEREDRYETAQALHEDLEAYVYGAGLVLSTGSLSAYMRALFPLAEGPRRRDPRAETAQLAAPPHRMHDLEEAEQVGAEEEPAPRMRSYHPISSIPLSDLPAELSEHEIDALDASLQTILARDEIGETPLERSASAKAALSAPRLPSIPALAPMRYGAPDPTDMTMMGDPDFEPEIDAAREAFEEARRRGEATHGRAHNPLTEPPSMQHPFEDEPSGFEHADDVGTMAFGDVGRTPGPQPVFDDAEHTPEFDVELAHHALHASHAPEGTVDEMERTMVPSDDEAYAALAAENPPEDLVITRLTGPDPSDLDKSRGERNTAGGSATVPKTIGVPKKSPDAYRGFDDEDDTTSAGRRGRT